MRKLISAGLVAVLGLGLVVHAQGADTTTLLSNFLTALRNGSLGFPLGTNAYGFITAQSDGVFTLWNAAKTDFTRLQFGGTTASFPALTKETVNSGIALSTKLADNSAYAINAALDYDALSAEITAGSGAGVTVNASSRLRRAVYKVTVTKDAFVTNGTTSDVTIATLPAKTALLAVYADLTQVFHCSAVCTSTTLSMTLGSAAGGAQYLASFDADAAAAQFGDADAELGTVMQRAAAIQGGAMSWAGNIVSLRLTSGTGNVGNGSVTNLDTGSVTFYLVTERLP